MKAVGSIIAGVLVAAVLAAGAWGWIKENVHRSDPDGVFLAALHKDAPAFADLPETDVISAAKDVCRAIQDKPHGFSGLVLLELVKFPEGTISPRDAGFLVIDGVTAYCPSNVDNVLTE